MRQIRRRLSFDLLGILAASTYGIACAPAHGTAVPSAVRVDSVLAGATFDSAWARIGATYYDTTFHGTDWARARAELRPRAVHAREMRDVRAAIESLFVRLGESHFALIPAEVADSWRDTPSGDSARAGDLGMEIRVVDDAALVSGLDSGSAAFVAGVRTGWVVERIGALDVTRLVASSRELSGVAARRVVAVQLPFRIMAAMHGAAGTGVRLGMRDGSGARRDVDIVRQPTQGEEVRFGHLPPQMIRFRHQRVDVDAGCVGVMRFDVWMTPVMRQMEQAMETMHDCRGIVLDLRGNVGGVAALVMGIGGYFTDSAVSLGTLTSRRVTLRYVVNPQRANRRGEQVVPFSGSLAILVDGLSASTSEIFAGGLQTLGRARVFGERTAGQALPSMLTRLPNGDVMQHVVADFVSPTGLRIEARGVTPDVIVPLRRVDLLAERDAAMESAMVWIASRPLGGLAATVRY